MARGVASTFEATEECNDPTPASPGPSTPVKQEPMEEEEIEQLADLRASGSGFIETPIMIKLGPREYT